MGESCNARNLINYLIKLFFWNICEEVLLNWIYFIKWRNNNIRGIILLFGEIMLEANIISCGLILCEWK